MELVVRTENLTKEFSSSHFTSLLKRRHRVRALDNLNLEIRSGEIFGYLGPNGAGKTTTFKLLVGLIFPTSGAAWVMGKHIGDVKVKREIGFLPEQPYFYDYLTAEEFLGFYAQLFRFDKETRRQKVHRLLEMVGLEEAAATQLRKFSRGMLQRVGIAQALINDPQFVILDEPLSGLDPFGRKEVRDIILNLKNEGRTVVFSSHILSDVEAICDRVGILMGGRLQCVENLDEILGVEVECVEMTVSGLSEEGREAVESMTVQVTHSGGRTVIVIHGINTTAGEETIVKVLSSLKKFGAKLVSMMSRTQSLEELFLAYSRQQEVQEFKVQEFKV